MRTAWLLLSAGVLLASCGDDDGSSQTADPVGGSDAAAGDGSTPTPQTGRDAAAPGIDAATVDAGREQTFSPIQAEDARAAPAVDASGGDASTADTSVPTDAAPLDAAQLDAAPLDAAQADAGQVDAGQVDAEQLDAEQLDAEQVDAALAADTSAADAGSQGPDLELQQRLLDKLRECQIVGDGEFHVRAIQDVFDRCMATCSVEASCEALHVTTCNAPLSNDELIYCYSSCTVLPVEGGFPCSIPIPHSWTCDTFEDCDNGEDEVDCGSFECADGTVVASALVRCDGKKQCADGSDEDGCASYCLD